MKVEALRLPSLAIGAAQIIIIRRSAFRNHFGLTPMSYPSSPSDGGPQGAVMVAQPHYATTNP